MKSDSAGDTFIRIPLAHGCLLVLTGEEYARGLLRGKMERRRESNEKRTRGEGNILEALGDRSERR